MGDDGCNKELETISIFWILYEHIQPNYKLGDLKVVTYLYATKNHIR